MSSTQPKATRGTTGEIMLGPAGVSPVQNLTSTQTLEAWSLAGLTSLHRSRLHCKCVMTFSSILGTCKEIFFKSI